MILNKHDGFTFVELIVVIVIIGILASVAVPKFIDLTDQAKAAKCLANQVVLENAALMAYAQNALNGAPAYPENIGELAPYFTSGYTTTCSDGTTPYVYNSSSGSVRCPNHLRQ